MRGIALFALVGLSVAGSALGALAQDDTAKMIRQLNATKDKFLPIALPTNPDDPNPLRNGLRSIGFEKTGIAGVGARSELANPNGLAALKSAGTSRTIGADNALSRSLAEAGQIKMRLAALLPKPTDRSSRSLGGSGSSVRLTLGPRGLGDIRLTPPPEAPK